MFSTLRHCPGPQTLSHICNGEFIHKHGDNTHTHTHTQAKNNSQRVGVMSDLMLHTSYFLPGITEIVFKALNTLKVRRAETLPRFTNSVKYL